MDDMADMDSSINAGSSGGGMSFGSLGFGSSAPKPANENKNVFGSSLFSNAATQSTAVNSQTAQQQKSPFSGGFLKNPTFTFGQAASNQPAQPTNTNIFGGGAASSGGLFGSNSSAAPAAQTQSGGLFSSFNTPPKSG